MCEGEKRFLPSSVLEFFIFTTKYSTLIFTYNILQLLTFVSLMHTQILHYALSVVLNIALRKVRAQTSGITRKIKSRSGELVVFTRNIIFFASHL